MSSAGHLPEQWRRQTWYSPSPGFTIFGWEAGAGVEVGIGVDVGCGVLVE